ncbi:DUF2920 family protein [Campylobacter helveticus]|uniref:DUF2920 family protein n=4 Tax=Campylobacter helveticus TaxID=28898 RepID=UPI002149FD33|nr:DUF2920 family protein [Campylobacter helveticus]MCR2067126.1 DUF2920 family protein [Campylobacter helveticus]
MIVDKSYFIDGVDDVELGIKRESKLEYRVSYDDSKDIKAFVFLIGGFGANANMNFFDFERKSVAKEHPVCVVQPLYHCFCARIGVVEPYNPAIIPNAKDIENLQNILQICKIDARVDVENYTKFFSLIDERLQEFKEAGELDANFMVHLGCDFVPKNGDYQNYGIMPALDIINVAKDASLKLPHFANLPKIYVGGSYGGYLAMLCAKIAPFYVDGVLDNSGVVLPWLPHILGRETGVPEFIINGKHYVLACFVKKFWTKDENSPYYFSNANYYARTILNTKHLQTLAEKSKKTIFVHYHSNLDDGAPVEQKMELSQTLKNLGFDDTLHLIKDENDLDGRTIKSLEHGLRMSDKALCRRELPKILEKLQGRQTPMAEDSEISYECEDKLFTFKDTRGGGYALDITNLS